MNVIKRLINYNNEKLFGSWHLTLIPLSIKRTRLGGKLFVTDKNLYFDVNFNIMLWSEVTVSTVSTSGNSLIISQEIMNQWQDNGYITIPKSEITEVTEKISFFKKTVTIKLSDNNQYVFDYGMFPVTKIAEAIRKNINNNIINPKN